MDTDKRIADLVALGTDGLTALDRIPATIAQILARRWLIEAARDAERARVRLLEEEAAERRAAASWKKWKAEASVKIAEVAADRAWREWLQGLTIVVDFVLDDKVQKRSEMASWHERDIAKFTKARALYDGGRLDDARSEIEHLVRSVNDLENETRRRNQAAWRNGIDEMIEKRAESLGVRWTAALLTSTVAMPDGTRVPWGEATIAQHEARIDMLAKHAASELETATRHKAAVEAIRAAGVSCLNELA